MSVNTLPWLDETFIIEAGRLFFAGGDLTSTIVAHSGTPLYLWYYIGSVFQELSFRAGGMVVARLSPYVGLILFYLAFRCWLKKTSSLSRKLQEGVSLIALTFPLLFQSVFLTRVDSWAFACLFWSITLLGTDRVSRSVARLAAAAFLATAAVFVWPTSVLALPLCVVLCFSSKSWKELIAFCFLMGVSAVIIAVPLLPHFNRLWWSFLHHVSITGERKFDLCPVAIQCAREFLRAPFVAVLTLFGGVAWVRQKRYMLLLAFGVSVVAAVSSRFYDFRFLYLMPYFLVMTVDAVSALVVYRPKICRVIIIIAVAYGVLSGPVAVCVLRYPTVPAGLEQGLKQMIGTGPKKVFAPDYVTYYIGRELGWHQFGFSDPTEMSDRALVEDLLGRVDYVIFYDFGRYETIQQSGTCLGLLCKYLYWRAKEEQHIPSERKSRAAQMGERFAGGWHQHLEPVGFLKIGEIDGVRVYKRSVVSQ